MRKIIFYLIPILTLIVFYVGLTSGSYLKKPTSELDDVAKHMRILKMNIEGGNWDAAATNLKKMKSAWGEVKSRIQFNVDKRKITEIDVKIARLQGLIEAKDKAGALTELSEAAMYWDSLGEF
ncbi:MAG: DUF4363 family protein [Firmicutes bacterium]|nr:DUF4363 family protein [Bacillota bacterium]